MGHSAFRDIPAPNVALPMAALPQECTCSVMNLSVATHFKVLQHDLMHSITVYLLQHVLTRRHRRFWCTFSSLDLPLGHNSFRGTPAAA